ncbi:MAG: HlyC/CorC family transporter [Candidatus Pacebacteria bacterium]|nr:HlyC/CorC family transporter [Candidatus Paceibacterota bacterium]
MNYLIIIILLFFSALFSGLTLGLMSLNAAELKRKISLGNGNAKKIYKVRKEGNLLLTTLLIGNVAINSALAIFLGSVASGFIAGITATILIVIFGEIIPQAVFSRFALTLGAKVVWMVEIFIFVLYPISWPIAWVLDKTLGKELATIYSKQELIKIVEEHGDTEESNIDVDEERIIKGALTFSEKTAKEVMTPRTVVTSFEFSQKIDESFLENLRELSFSRIPIYQNNPDNIVGILYLSQLLGKKNMGKTVGEIVDEKIIFVDKNQKLDNIFNKFLKTKQHLFIVKDEFNGVVGVITLEDILEEIIKSEIVDENDKHEDLREFAKNK